MTSTNGDLTLMMGEDTCLVLILKFSNKPLEDGGGRLMGMQHLFGHI